jgi:hypothetical protein
MSRISKRNARIIRAAINARCTPYESWDYSKPGYLTVLDFVSYRKRQYAWEDIKHLELAQRAYCRTKQWTTTTYRAGK